MRTDCEGRRGGLEKTNWELRLCLDLNQRVSVIQLIRPPDSYRWDSKEQLSCLLFFISNMELKVPGWECALQPVMLWLMLFQRLLQHESREKISRMSGSLHSVLCFRCAENRANPPRKVFSFFFFVFSFRCGRSNLSEKRVIFLRSPCSFLPLLLTEMHYLSCEENLQ